MALVSNKVKDEVRSIVIHSIKTEYIHIPLKVSYLFLIGRIIHEGVAR